jgi:hypothetical protein
MGAEGGEGCVSTRFYRLTPVGSIRVNECAGSEITEGVERSSIFLINYKYGKRNKKSLPLKSIHFDKGNADAVVRYTYDNRIDIGVIIVP